MGYRNIFMHRRVVSRFSVDFFCRSTEKRRWRALRCLRKFWVSKNFMHEKGISLFSVEFFCFTVPIKFVGKLLCVSKILVSKFFMHRRWRGVITVLSNFFLSHRTETKNVVREPFCVLENIWYGKKLYGSEGFGGGADYHVFRRIFQCSQCRKIS